MRIIDENIFRIVSRSSAKDGSPETFVLEKHLHQIWEPAPDDDDPEITGRIDSAVNSLLIDNVRAERISVEVRDTNNISVYSDEISLKHYDKFNGYGYKKRFWTDFPEQNAGTISVRLVKGKVTNPCIGMIFAGRTLFPFKDPDYPFSESPANSSNYWELDGGYVETDDGNIVRILSVSIKIINDREQYYALTDRLNLIKSKPCAWLLIDSADESQRFRYAVYGLIPPKSPPKYSINKHSTGVVQFTLRECI
ncbi:MAG: hypothetical protein GY749_06940 [Desulfobacteraceae bacterium]|nr:hypothetical protein [Desulfobacteraceae bacterium]